MSTSASINDFRGPSGVWTARARGIVLPSRTVPNPEPTLTHMAHVELMRKNYLKFLISQNCDGLHLKSGILPNKIAELHGNSNCEACAKCRKICYRHYIIKRQPLDLSSETVTQYCYLLLNIFHEIF
ncbi:unnamed protein product [Adineta steineri]|uniref:protein acetyllysine N-acetyltransferase n=1 Tax=Adineta steineri TaxID=433720 RepID=A0A819FEX3_9BILA|nr:unnamed protein product [Adineta steineri]CAF3866518.1 unnamed protein product [Adineta steineri]